MSRVRGVIDPQTIAVERDGALTSVRLAGIEITDSRNAVALLTWALKDSWVLVENGLVYRSPDGLLVNRELVAKGFARSTASETAVTGTHRGVYLGEAAPGTATHTTARAKEPTPKPSAGPLPRTLRRASRVTPKRQKRPAG